MKRFFLIALVCAVASIANAKYNLVIEPTSGDITYWESSTLKKITFSEGNVVVSATSGETSHAIAQIAQMYFEGCCTGLQSVYTTTDYSWNNHTLQMIAVDGTSVRVHSITGQVVCTATMHNNQVELNNLSEGIYLVTVGNSVVKLLKR